MTSLKSTYAVIGLATVLSTVVMVPPGECRHDYDGTFTRTKRVEIDKPLRGGSGRFTGTRDSMTTVRRRPNYGVDQVQSRSDLRGTRSGVDGSVRRIDKHSTFEGIRPIPNRHRD